MAGLEEDWQQEALPLSWQLSSIVSPSLTDEGFGATVISGAACCTFTASTSSDDSCQNMPPYNITTV